MENTYKFHRIVRMFKEIYNSLMYYTNSIKPFKLARLILKYPRASFNLLTDLGKNIFLKNNIPPFPREIILFSTNRCNLNCAMCLNAAYRSEHLARSDFNTNTLNKILPELKKYKPFIYITGGEPFLNKDIFKFISILSTNNIFTSLTTNGFYLEEYAQKIINSGLEFISISLDHFEEKKHDNGRGVKKSYQRLIRGLKKLVALRGNSPSNIKINTVIRKDNYSQLSKMYDFIENLRIDEWSLQHYSFTNPTANKSISDYARKKKIGYFFEGVPIKRDSYFEENEVIILQEQLEEVIKKSKIYKTRLSIKPKMDNILSYYQGKFPSKKSHCSFPFDSVNILEESKVTLCLGYEIGNLHQEKSLKEIWQSSKARKFQNLISEEKLLPPCFRCCALGYIFE